MALVVKDNDTMVELSETVAIDENDTLEVRCNEKSANMVPGWSGCVVRAWRSPGCVQFFPSKNQRVTPWLRVRIGH